ncbi:hypothetical protein CASFOL_028196 [Castilleja foliolosa]|uniref:rhamnogalacturonan endolyase n=1 Tax=Castilleja foliolosa TaxID=1961234 RepID=A0ABD3CEW8_9LAMI
MGTSGPRNLWNLVIWWLGGVAQLCVLHTTTSHELLHDQTLLERNNGVQLFEHKHHVVMSNGIVNVTLAVPDGLVTSVTYKGSDNLLQTQNKEDNRGYWDLVWNKPGVKYGMDKLAGTSYKVIMQSKVQTEISFTTNWTVGSAKIPLNIDKRFVMLKDSPGFYSYAVLERLKGWPAFDIQEGRIVFKLQENKFHYMAMSDKRQRIMPMPEDRKNGEVLDYPEAVLLTRPTNAHLKGEVDDKYLYSCDNKDNKVHGWVSNHDPPLGFWMITPSNEFRTGGPFKQDLTSHVGPTVLSMFISTHYAGKDIAIKFQENDYWKKVLGPIYVYLNSHVSANTNPTILWDDAKKRMHKEKVSWPYSFPLSRDFFKSRGAVKGQLFIRDWYKNKNAVPGASAYVGLAPPGAAGSWQLENKGYQFWSKTDKKGFFVIKKVIPGKYSLFASVPGYIGDYKHTSDITIVPGNTIVATNIVFEPPREGATLWEIGIPDRTAAEFFIPDPSPTIQIHQYPRPDNQQIIRFRQYGLWARYADYHPQVDLVYTVGKSNYTKDWFFSHVTRNLGNNHYEPTTWRIEFDINKVNREVNYTLQLALASANGAELQVRFNNQESAPHFTSGLIGKDNAIARHGIHGLYHLYSIGVSGSLLVDGRNTIFLTQARKGPFVGIMYDYIRFEGPSPKH